MISIRNPEWPDREDNFQLELLDAGFEVQDQAYKAKEKENFKSLSYSGLDKLLAARHSEQMKTVESLFDLYVSETFRPEKGVLIGTGEVSPYNVGFRLSQPYGLPYLPGSGIQGMLRSYIVQQVFGKNETMALADEGFYKIFGGERPGADATETEYHRGIVDFLDAYPKTLDTNSVRLEAFTNHFGKYYLNGEDPVDTMNPVPISYLRMSDVSFQVFAAIQGKDDNEPIEKGWFKDFPPLTVVARYLSLAAAYQGVGARTKNNLGKGRLDIRQYYQRNLLNE